MRCKTLTAAIVRAIRNRGQPLTYKEIADEIEVSCLWGRMQDGKLPTAWHIYDRVRRSPGAFIVDKSTLRAHTVDLNGAEPTCFETE